MFTPAWSAHVASWLMFADGLQAPAQRWRGSIVLSVQSGISPSIPARPIGKPSLAAWDRIADENSWTALSVGHVATPGGAGVATDLGQARRRNGSVVESVLAKNLFTLEQQTHRSGAHTEWIARRSRKVDRSLRDRNAGHGVTRLRFAQPNNKRCLNSMESKS